MQGSGHATRPACAASQPSEWLHASLGHRMICSCLFHVPLVVRGHMLRPAVWVFVSFDRPQRRYPCMLSRGPFYWHKQPWPRGSAVSLQTLLRRLCLGACLPCPVVERVWWTIQGPKAHFGTQCPAYLPRFISPRRQTMLPSGLASHVCPDVIHRVMSWVSWLYPVQGS